MKKNFSSLSADGKRITKFRANTHTELDDDKNVLLFQSIYGEGGWGLRTHSQGSASGMFCAEEVTVEHVLDECPFDGNWETGWIF